MSNEATPEKATPETTPTSCAPSNGSARSVAVTDDLIRKIVERAMASAFGLTPPEASLDLSSYAKHNKETLALVLVSAWTGKYDLVSVFAAALSVIEEEAQNDRTEQRRDRDQL